MQLKGILCHLASPHTKISGQKSFWTDLAYIKMYILVRHLIKYVFAGTFTVQIFEALFLRRRQVQQISTVTINIQVSELAGKMGHKQVPDMQNWFINSSCLIKVVGRGNLQHLTFSSSYGG